MCRAGEGRVEEQDKPRLPSLKETETEQGGGAFLVEVKCGVGRFQKPPRVAKSRVFTSK